MIIRFYTVYPKEQKWRYEMDYIDAQQNLHGYPVQTLGAWSIDRINKIMQLVANETNQTVTAELFDHNPTRISASLYFYDQNTTENTL